MSKTDKYFQFPVSALQLDTNPLDVDRNQAVERLDEILGYCVIEVGKNYIAKHDEDTVETIIEDSPWTPNCQLTKHHKNVLVGMSVLGVAFSNPESKVLTSTYKDEYNTIDNRSRGSKILRLRSDLFWSYRTGSSDWTWREFSIVCGVYAGIGAKPSARLSYQYIAALAAGYSRIADMPKHHAMSMHIVRHSVRKLESRGLFRSLCPNGRHAFYTNSLCHEKLADALVLKEVESIKTAKAKAQEALRQRMAKLYPQASKQPPKPPGRVTTQSSTPEGNGKPKNGKPLDQERMTERTTEQRRQEILKALGSNG